MPRREARHAARRLGAALALLSAHALAQAAPEPPAGAPAAPETVVTVEGSRQHATPSSSRDRTAASTVLRGEALRRPGQSAASALERVPGVQISRAGAGAELATASVRGASAAQLPVYLAGVRLNDDVTGSADLSTVPLWLLDRVELFRGNAPADAERLGLGGALYFEPRLPRGDALSAGVELGSFGYGAVHGVGSVSTPAGGALLGVRREGARNDYEYLDDHGTRFDARDDVRVRRHNADHTSTELWAIGRARLGRQGRLRWMFNGLGREQGVTGLGLIPATRARAALERRLVAVSAEQDCARAPSACSVELGTSLLLTRVGLSDPRGELALQAPRVDTEGRRLSQRVGWRQRLGARVRLGLSLGQSVEQLGITALGEGSALSARRSVSQAGAEASVLLGERWELLGLLVEECQTTRAAEAAPGCAEATPSGRLGARVQLAPWLVALGNLGRSSRVPTLGELYGVSPVVRGNARLEPERGVTADLGLRAELSGATRRAPSGYAEGFAFARRAERLIAYRQSSLGVLRPFNVGEAQLLGLEAAAGLRLWDAWRLDLNATLLDPRDVTPGRQLVSDVLPYRSRAVVAAQTEGYYAPRGELLGVERLALTLRGFHRSSRYADPAGLIVIPGHTSVDLELSALLLEGRLGVRAALQNLLDAVSFDAVGLPLPGRALYGSVEARLW